MPVQVQPLPLTGVPLSRSSSSSSSSGRSQAQQPQPLPLPQGVSENALGAEVPSTPEPEVFGAVAVALSMLAMLRRRARRHDKRRLTA